MSITGNIHQAQGPPGDAARRDLAAQTASAKCWHAFSRGYGSRAGFSFLRQRYETLGFSATAIRSCNHGKEKPAIGSSFDSWLDEEGIREEVTAAAIKAVIARQLMSEMKRKVTNGWRHR